MQISEYQELAARTLLSEPGKEFSSEEKEMVCGIILAMQDFGQAVDALKKHIFHQHPLDDDERADLIKLLLQSRSYLYGLTKILSGEANVINQPLLKPSPQQWMQIWCMIGLVGETGEVLSAFNLSNLSDMPKEIGDVSWYSAGLATSAGFQMEDILKQNIDRLKERYPEGFDTEKSINRVS